jgi:hypothetical protein
MGWEHHMKHMRIVLLLVLAQLAGSSAVGASPPATVAIDEAGNQHWTLNFPVGEFHALPLDSGQLANQTRGFAVVYDQAVSVADAMWIRLYFGHVALDAGSYLRITSAKDGEIQELDGSGLTLWQNTSAYFNGDTVYLELVAAPGSRGNQVVLERVAVQMAPADRGPCADDDCGICGSDDRVPSDELWSCRLMPVGCSASVYNMNSCLVSAGHCADFPSPLVAEFDVPSSHSNCSTESPPVADQFPVTDREFLNEGPGADWSVMTTGPNNQGQTAYERYGQYRPITEYSAPPGTQSEVWGYGVDNDNPTRSQTQQYSDGEITERHSTYYVYNDDTTYGNSGSGLLNGNDDTIVGIVTHCGLACDNIATRTDRGDFVEARELLCPTIIYCSASASDTSYEYISHVVVGSIDQSSGSDGYHDYSAAYTDMYREADYTITVTIGSSYSSDIGGLWVDWNQDGDFSDAGETLTTAWSGTGPYTTTITPPASAYFGYTRMRIRIQDGTYDPVLDPCGTTDYGEVEDYTLHIIPFVDTTPPSPNPMTFASPPSAAGTTSITMTATTAVDADSPPVVYEFDFVSGGTGGDGSGWQYSTEYTDSGLEINTIYTYHVRARDSAATPNITAPSANMSAATAIETPQDISFGLPTSTSVTLNAVGLLTKLVYGQSGVYFDSTTPGGDGGINQWVQQTSDTATGLTPNTNYTFRVKARNQDGVETPYSPTETATTRIETPTGISFGTITSSSVQLNASGTFTGLTLGSSGLYFDSTTAGGDGGINEWVQDTSDTATGLAPNTQYTFRARARNQVGAPTPYCGETPATTLAETPPAPTLGSPTMTSMDLDVNPGANPAATQFAIKCTASADPAWNNRFVNAAGQPAAAEVWQTDAAWATITLQGMQPGTAYTFAVKARNSGGTQTAFGPGATLSTLGESTGACCDAIGACSEMSPTTCSGMGDTYMGDGSTCTPSPCCTGQHQADTNCDGLVNGYDIDPFVLALTDPEAWQATYQQSGCSFLCVADCNGDGAVNGYDIDPFVGILTGGK